MLMFALVPLGVVLYLTAAMKLGRYLATRSPAEVEEPEPEPVIDLDQLYAELSMEFHEWPKAA